MATQHLSVQAPEGKSPQDQTRQTVDYTSKDGRRIDLVGLMTNLEIIADDIDTAIWLANDGGDPELARALEEMFTDVIGLVPAPGTGVLS